MCRPKSFIFRKNSVYMPLDTDSHTDMIEELRLKDDSLFPNFVKGKVVPVDGDVFNHEMDNWEITVDQDQVPDWFCKETYEDEVRTKLARWWELRFINGGTLECLSEGLWYFQAGVISVMDGGTLANMRGGIVVKGDKIIVAHGSKYELEIANPPNNK